MVLSKVSSNGAVTRPGGYAARRGGHGSIKPGMGTGATGFGGFSQSRGDPNSVTSSVMSLVDSSVDTLVMVRGPDPPPTPLALRSLSSACSLSPTLTPSSDLNKTAASPNPPKNPSTDVPRSRLRGARRDAPRDRRGLPLEPGARRVSGILQSGPAAAPRRRAARGAQGGSGHLLGRLERAELAHAGQVDRRDLQAAAGAAGPDTGAAGGDGSAAAGAQGHCPLAPLWTHTRPRLPPGAASAVSLGIPTASLPARRCLCAATPSQSLALRAFSMRPSPFLSASHAPRPRPLLTPSASQELQSEYHAESAARKAAEERWLAALASLEELRGQQAAVQGEQLEREALAKQRLELDVELAEIGAMEEEASECIKARRAACLSALAEERERGQFQPPRAAPSAARLAGPPRLRPLCAPRRRPQAARHAKDLLRSADARSKGQGKLDRAAVLSGHSRREEALAGEFRRLRVLADQVDKERDLEVRSLRSAVAENTRDVVAAYEEAGQRRKDLDAIKRALEHMDERLFVGSNTAATIRQEIEATQGELRRRVEAEHQSRRAAEPLVFSCSRRAARALVRD